MPAPQEVDTWFCKDQPDNNRCSAAWQSCDECDGHEADDEACAVCSGSGGGYVCAVHDADVFTKLIAA